MYFYIMGKDYWKQLPSGHSQQQGDDSGVRQESPRKQDKPDVILPVINSRAVSKAHVPLYDRKEYERRVKAVLEGNILESPIRETADMLGRQIDLLNGIPLDVLRNNRNKLVNQDMDVVPLEEMNQTAEDILHQVAENMHDSKLMSRYVEELTKKDREKWQQSQVCMAMMKGGETVCEYIEAKAEEHGVVSHCLPSGRQGGPCRLSSPCLLHRHVPPEQHHDVPLGDGLYADLCLVSNLGHQ